MLIRVFRHLENTQNSQNFERAFQVQENGGTESEIINLLKFVLLTTIGPFYWCDCKQILSHQSAARGTIITWRQEPRSTSTLSQLKWIVDSLKNWNPWKWSRISQSGNIFRFLNSSPEFKLLRAAVCKYREFAVKTEFSKSFIFGQKNPFGKTFSKITIKASKEFFFSRKAAKSEMLPHAI